MAPEFGLQPTGHEMIDALQGLQIVVDRIDHVDQKIDRVIAGLAHLAAGTMLGRQFMISTLQVLGKDPDAAPNDRVHFKQSMLFIAELDAYGYLVDPNVPVDSLALTFLHPEIIGMDERDGRKMRDFSFQVPVLAIESCCNA